MVVLVSPDPSRGWSTSAPRAAILRPVDGVALASVITSGVLGITTSSIAVWSARQNAKLARETRTHQRLADSYLEVLRIVEREGQWIEARITNVKIAIEEWATVGADAVVNPEVVEEAGFNRVKRPPEPAVTDRAAIAAHLAAFGSPKVRGLYQDWRSTATAIDTEYNTVDYNANVNYPDPTLGLDDLKHLDELGNQELAERQKLADAIAGELGHR